MMDKAIEKAWKNLGPSRFCLFVEWLTFYSIIFIVGLVLLVGIYLMVIAGYLSQAHKVLYFPSSPKQEFV